MDIVTGVELECSYGAGDGRTRSGVASMPKERSGGPRLDRSCDWEKYGYDSRAGNFSCSFLFKHHCGRCHQRHRPCPPLPSSLAMPMVPFYHCSFQCQWPTSTVVVVVVDATALVPRCHRPLQCQQPASTVVVIVVDAIALSHHCRHPFQCQCPSSTIIHFFPTTSNVSLPLTLPRLSLVASLSLAATISSNASSPFCHHISSIPTMLNVASAADVVATLLLLPPLSMSWYNFHTNTGYRH